MADQVRYEIGVSRHANDQGGTWMAWADQLHIDPNHPDGWRHECFVTNPSADLRAALWPVIEATVRRAEAGEIDELRRRNAELEQYIAEDAEASAIAARNCIDLAAHATQLEQRIAELQSGIGRIDP